MKAGWVALAATVVTLAGPAVSAHADFGDTFKGGCGFVTAQDGVVTIGSNVGYIYNLSVSEEQSGLPSDATVSCWIAINGNQATNPLTVTDDTVPGVEAGEKQISFIADGFDALIQLCQQVTFRDGSTWVAPDGSTGTDCRDIGEAQVPPQPIIDLLPGLKQAADIAVCPVLVTIGNATGHRVLGAVFVNADGDIYLAQPVGTSNIWVYDCPAYGNGTGTPLINPGSLPINPDFLRFLLPPTL